MAWNSWITRLNTAKAAAVADELPEPPIIVPVEPVPTKPPNAIPGYSARCAKIGAVRMGLTAQMDEFITRESLPTYPEGSVLKYMNALVDKKSQEDGKYPPEQQAAIVTGLNADGTVSLKIFYRTGIFDMPSVPFSDTYECGHWSWPPRVEAPGGVPER